MLSVGGDTVASYSSEVISVEEVVNVDAAVADRRVAGGAVDDAGAGGLKVVLLLALFNNNIINSCTFQFILFYLASLPQVV